eukprot:COSAG02_NODE_6249_length_3700_cov_2.212441_1_plen_133_part_00
MTDLACSHEEFNDHIDDLLTMRIVARKRFITSSQFLESKPPRAALTPPPRVQRARARANGGAAGVQALGMVQQKRGQYATVGDDGSDEEGDSPVSHTDGGHAQLEQHAVRVPPSHKQMLQSSLHLKWFTSCQ